MLASAWLIGRSRSLWASLRASRRLPIGIAGVGIATVLWFIVIPALLVMVLADGLNLAGRKLTRIAALPVAATWTISMVLVVAVVAVAGGNSRLPGGAALPVMATHGPLGSNPEPTREPSPAAVAENPATPEPTPTPTPDPTATPTVAPTPPPTRAPAVKVTPKPTAAPAIGVFGNPWGYNFKLGTRIYNPPAEFCDYFDCIASFWNGSGYVVQCVDLTFSLSGGRSGVCSHHGGYYRTLYDH